MIWGSVGFATIAVSTGLSFTRAGAGAKMSAGEKAFSDRGLDYEVAVRLGADFSQGTFRFQYRKGGKLLFNKFRSEDKSRHWIDPSGSPLQAWGLDEVPVSPEPLGRDDLLVITEGEFDRIAVAQIGQTYHLSVPNGTSGRRTDGPRRVSEDRGFSWLWTPDEKLIPQIDQFSKILLFTDGDEPGTILRDELAMRIGQERCWFLPYPEGASFKDANDILRKWGADGLRKALAAFKPMRPGHVMDLYDVPKTGPQTAYSTGWNWMDDHLKLVRPELMVVTGVPGHGKGAWIKALCSNLAYKHGLRTCFLVPEDPPHRVRRDLYRFALHKLASPTRYTPEEAKAFVQQHFRIVLPPADENISIDFVESEMAAAALHHGCQVFCLDPWNEVSHEMGSLTETQYIEQTVVKLKQTARRYNLILIIAAHPRKVDQGQIPDLYKINGSANWYNKCDHGVIIHRLENPRTQALTDIANIIIQKSKDHETMGRPGKVLAKLAVNRFDYVHVEEPDDDGQAVASAPAPAQDDDEIPF
jgi:twinkle protein